MAFPYSAFISLAVFATTGLLVVPVSSVHIRSDRHSAGGQPTLYVSTPAYIGHLDKWASFIGSVLVANETTHGSKCDFGKTIMTTIVSDEGERVLFQERLKTVESSCGGKSPLTNEIRITTLEEVLRRTEATNSNDMNTLIQRLDGERSKHYLQAAKKMYGCLEAAGLKLDGHQPHPGDVCLVVDADSYLLRNSLCHLATAYMKQKTVFVSRFYNNYNSLHNATVERSRDMLKVSKDSKDDDFGEFYAMESYHWVFEFNLLQQYIRRISMPSMLLAWDTEAHHTIPFDRLTFFEEAYYHFLYPHRKKAGYTYVDVSDMMEDIVGRPTFEHMRSSYRPEGSFFEGLDLRLPQASHWQAKAIGKALRSHGVLQMRCDVIKNENAQTVMEFIDLCSSSYAGGPPACLPPA